MSRIDKLSILGVRSFDNTHSEAIQFHTPLTLIVGLNGSGKTTIIECLKYITTGDQPPNTKGGAFVHDPRICGEKEVLAQVKMSFRSIEGIKMVCTRNLQLTVKKASVTLKALEGSLRVLRDGETTTMSSRVAEMNNMMQARLGVSKAILDNVIFCHQDESLWPLAPAADLKKRFDEIFEAQKYTRAVDNIKIIQKDQKIALNLFKKDEEASKLEKDRGERMQKDAEILDAECTKLRTEVDRLGDLTREAGRKAEIAWQQSTELGAAVSELHGKRIAMNTKQESVDSIREHLNEMSDTDDELQQILEQYDERVAVQEEELDSHKARYQDLLGQIADTRKRMVAKERECGSYEAQKDNYDRQIQTRQQLIKDAARTHSIRGFDFDVDDEQVRAFMDRINKLVRDQSAIFERARREHQEALQQEQKALNGLSEKRSALMASKESSRNAITSYDRKIASLQTEHDEIVMDEGRKASLESASRDVKLKLDAVNSEIEKANFAEQLQHAEAELREMEERKDRVDAEMMECTRQAKDSARLDYLCKTLKDRQTGLDTMKGAHSDKINSLVGHDWTTATVEAAYQRVLAEHNSSLADVERQTDGTSRELQQVEYQTSTTKKALQTKKQQVASATQKIREVLECEPEAYHEEVQEINQNLNLLKYNANTFEQTNLYFESCIKMAREQQCCRTCLRALGKESEISALIKNLNDQKKKLEQQLNLSQSAEQVEEYENLLAGAERLRTDYDTWERVKRELPGLEEEQASLNKQYQKLCQHLEDQEALVKERQRLKRDVEAVGRTIQSVSSYHNDIVDLERQIDELRQQQKSAGLARGMEIVEDELKQINEKTRDARARLKKTSSERDRTSNRKTELDLEWRDIQAQLSKAGFQLEKRMSLQNQMDEQKSLSADQVNNVKAKDQELQSLVPLQSQAQARYDDIAHRSAEKDRELQTELNQLNSSVSNLKSAEREINDYIDRGGPDLLQRGKREVEQLKSDVTRLESEQTSVVRDTKQLDENLRNHKDTKRGIEDNLRYRRDLRQLHAVRAEIEHLESLNVEADKAQFEAEGHKWQQQRQRHAADQASVAGELKSKDQALEKSMKDWETEYKDAARKYKEAHIKVETCKACIDDLAKYGGALDKAIMKYHSIKMEEINRIVDELWRRTYQGTDVDTILLRSESDEGRSNKSYNYRLCMVKQDTEMDMRGRCSAGQKVLASIIIRLALAECFGVNCGILALDEPTTNLDRDNIRALAMSLSDIIKHRRKQKNFQLIVITHDEEFLRFMNCSEHADVYYRVSRNERQKSEIRQQSIAEVAL